MSESPNIAAPSAARRRGRGLLIAVIVILILLLPAWQGAAFALKRQVLAALGPEATVGRVHIGLGSVLVEGVSIAAPKGWPSAQTLRAERLRVEPDLRSLFSGQYRVGQITIEQGYLSLLRSREGKLRLLPSLLERAREKDQASGGGFALRIDAIELKDSEVDFYDGSLGRKPVNLRLEALQARFGPLQLPELQGRSELQVEALVRSKPRDGTIKLEGWLELATQESDVKLTLREIDMKQLEPYLLKASEAGVERGRLDLDLHSKVKQRRLTAPGRLLLRDLKLRSGGGFGGTFMGVSRGAVVGALKSGGDRIDLSFTLEGNIDNPQFSLNETLSVKLAVGMAQSLGVGVADMVKSVGSATGRGLGAVGGAVKDLFGSDD
ncbi:MAG TPA: DUF748 domain-containing protein [Solimonas sp.]|nr:DUF748 domain-containing protein [Solimonas sp.]